MASAFFAPARTRRTKTPSTSPPSSPAPVRILDFVSFASSSSSSSIAASTSNTAALLGSSGLYVVGMKKGASFGFFGPWIGLFRSRISSRRASDAHCTFGSMAMVARPGATGSGARRRRASLPAPLGPASFFASSAASFSAFSARLTLGSADSSSVAPRMISPASPSSAWSLGSSTSVSRASPSSVVTASSESESSEPATRVVAPPASRVPGAEYI
mmetsp:Transcript_3957/g.14729  ORF Transcript_3957/g.14729 Transcript_3957/m.14729 type:complete len:216 (-) Transcript_3957:2360-3007(-)